MMCVALAIFNSRIIYGFGQTVTHTGKIIRPNKLIVLFKKFKIKIIVIVLNLVIK